MTLKIGARRGGIDRSPSRFNRRFAARRSDGSRAVCSRRAHAAVAAMFWRQVSKSQKTVLIVLFYFTIYFLISYAITPEPNYKFLRDELRIGDKYALIFLARPRSPIYTDSEGAEVFKSRRCGNCFITNNKGFLPMSDYDAVLVHGDRKLLHESSAFVNPSQRYLIETSKTCIRSKLKTCRWEPKITSFSTKETFNLCGLCDHLIKKRFRKKNY